MVPHDSAHSDIADLVTAVSYIEQTDMSGLNTNDIRALLVETSLFLTARSSGDFPQALFDKFRSTEPTERIASLLIVELSLKAELANATKQSKIGATSEDEEEEEDIEEEDEESEDDEETKIAAAAQKLAEKFTYKKQIIKFTLKMWDADTGRQTVRMGAISKSETAKDKVSQTKSWLRDKIQALGINGLFVGLAKLMDSSRTVDVIVRLLGTALLPVFVVGALLVTLLRFTKNPFTAFGRFFKDIYEGSILEEMLAQGEGA